MKRHLININNKISKYLKEYPEITTDVLIRSFNNNINIKIHKENNQLKIILNNNTYFKLVENSNNKTENILINLINLLNDCHEINLTIQKENNNIRMNLYSNFYQNIFNYCLPQENKYYLLNTNNFTNFEHQIKIYNELIKPTNIEIDQIKEIDNFYDIKNYYNQNNTNTLIICSDDNQRILILKGTKNIKFKFNNQELFDKIIIPEILNLYTNNYSTITKEKKDTQFNRMFYSINDNLYIINLKEEIVESNIKYLYELINKKKYQLDINKDLVIPKDEHHYEPIQNKNYSYGYVNILLISFILSLLTIIICIFKS